MNRFTILLSIICALYSCQTSSSGEVTAELRLAAEHRAATIALDAIRAKKAGPTEIAAAEKAVANIRLRLAR